MREREGDATATPGAARRGVSPFVVLALLGASLALLGLTVWAQALLVGLVGGHTAAEALAIVTRDPGALALAQLVGLGVPVAIGAQLSLGGAPAFFRRALAPCPHSRVAMAFVAGIALQFPMVALSQALASLWPALAPSAAEHAALRETLRMHDAYSALTVPLAVVVLAPITEELLFRAFAQGELMGGARRRTVRLTVIAIVAGLFAAFHMDATGAPSIFLAGIALGALVERWRSIRVSIALHMGVNLVPVVLTEDVLPIAGFNDAEPTTQLPWGLVAASTAVFAAAFGWACGLDRRREVRHARADA